MWIYNGKIHCQTFVWDRGLLYEMYKGAAEDHPTETPDTWGSHIENLIFFVK